MINNSVVNKPQHTTTDISNHYAIPPFYDAANGIENSREQNKGHYRNTACQQLTRQTTRVAEIADVSNHEQT